MLRKIVAHNRLSIAMFIIEGWLPKKLRTPQKRTFYFVMFIYMFFQWTSGFSFFGTNFANEIGFEWLVSDWLKIKCVIWKFKVKIFCWDLGRFFSDSILWFQPFNFIFGKKPRNWILYPIWSMAHTVWLIDYNQTSGLYF